MNATNKKILHLTIKGKWFDKIARGEKVREYREVKPHWRGRLLHTNGARKEYEEIHIRNGYSMDKPFMRIKWKGWEYQKYEGTIHFAIDVSEILEIKNWSE